MQAAFQGFHKEFHQIQHIHLINWFLAQPAQTISLVMPLKLSKSSVVWSFMCCILNLKVVAFRSSEKVFLRFQTTFFVFNVLANNCWVVKPNSSGGLIGLLGFQPNLHLFNNHFASQKNNLFFRSDFRFEVIINFI